MRILYFNKLMEERRTLALVYSHGCVQPRLEISINRYYILFCYRSSQILCFQFFYRFLPFLCVLLTFYPLVETLNFTFVLVESAYAYIVSFLLCYVALYNIILKVHFFIHYSTLKIVFSLTSFI